MFLKLSSLRTQSTRFAHGVGPAKRGNLLQDGTLAEEIASLRWQ